tara:strand:+ start:501 stop:938 length:438 start_codon:yes stop_codon:yes gene_type:complete
MSSIKQISKTYINHSRKCSHQHKLHFILAFFSAVILLPIQQAKSEKISLKCIGKYEINRGELIKPDWETSHLTINLDGLKSTIYEKGIMKQGRTLIRRDSFIITHRDNRNRIKTIYKINETHNTYIVDYPQRDRTLIGTCEKGRG